jgi:Protein of unknown function (DUF2844)
MNARYVICPMFTIAISFLSLSLSSFGALGGDLSSVQTDTVQMKGTLRVLNAQAYTVHEIRTASGTSVREFANAAGKIFCVTWDGPFLPDMQQILGDYFEQAVQAAKSNRANHKTLVINEPGLVVQSGGHTRSFVGRAYLPDMVPAGVSLESMR